MANKISVLIDVTIDNAVKSLKGFRTAVSEADGFVDKFKAGASAGFEAVKSNAGLLAAGAGAALLKYGGAIVDAGVQMEAMKAKSKTVFGDSLGEIQAWADKSAGAMGLTATEAVNAGASIADLLIPMGFTKQAAADNSLELLKLGGALSAWSGGQRSATEVSQIFTKAMLGEREELKSLGISISEADVQAKLAEKGQKALTGAALAQAKAVATQELIYERSTDAQKAWTDGSMDGVKAANESKASFARLQEVLNESLYPALTKLVPVIADTAEGLVPLAGSLGTVASGGIDAAQALGLLASDSDQAYVAFREFAGAFEEAGLDWGRYSIDIQTGVITQEEALADLAAAQQANIDITDRAANQAEYYKVALDENTSAADRNSTAFQGLSKDRLDDADAAEAAAVAARKLTKDERDNAEAADDAAIATGRFKRSVSDLQDEISDEQSFLDLQDTYDAYIAKQEDATASDREKRQSSLDVKAALLEQLDAIEDLPLEKRTEILTLINQEKYADALMTIASIPDSKTLNVNIVARGDIGYMKNARGTPPGGSPGGLTLVGEEGPELVDMPKGAVVTPAGRTRQLLAGAKRAAGAAASVVNNYYTTNVTTGVDPRQVREIVRRDVRAGQLSIPAQPTRGS